MSIEVTLGARLLALKQRAGMSLAEVARAAGYQGASSIQKLFKADYNPKALNVGVADRLARAFVNKGQPPIEASELVALTGAGDTFENLIADLKHYTYVASAFIGMHQTRRTNDTLVTENGEAVPLFIRRSVAGSFPIYPCPAHLRSRQVVGLYVTVGNMWPRYEEGEPIFYEHTKPAAVGDDVIVTVMSEEDLDGGMIVGRLRLIHEDEVQIDILSPAGRIVIPRSVVIGVRRIMNASDMLEPLTYAVEA